MRSRDELERLLKLKDVDDALLCGGGERVIWDKVVSGLWPSPEAKRQARLDHPATHQGGG